MFDVFQRLQVRFMGPAIRAAGKGVYRLGNAIRGPLGSTDRVLPCPNQVAIHEKSPDIQHMAFVGPNTSIVGEVTASANSVVYFGCNIKTDGLDSSVTIGKDTIINDLVTIKASKGHELRIGDNCFISSNSMLSNCKIGNNVVIGLNAVIGEGVEVGDGAFIAAGAILEKGQAVPPKELWAGSPAKFLRNVTADEMEFLTDLRIQHGQLGEIYLHEAKKSDSTCFLENKLMQDEIEGEEPGMSSDMIMKNWVEISERFKFPVTEDDFRFSWNKRARVEEYSQMRFARPEINYDGNKENLSKQLNINKPNYQKYNQIKNSLENDADTKRPKDADLRVSRQTYNDDNFHRKF